MEPSPAATLYHHRNSDQIYLEIIPSGWNGNEQDIEENDILLFFPLSFKLQWKKDIVVIFISIL